MTGDPIGIELIGLAGDDRYIVISAGDTVTESAGEGTDTVATAVGAYPGGLVTRLQHRKAALETGRTQRRRNRRSTGLGARPQPRCHHINHQPSKQRTLHLNGTNQGILSVSPCSYGNIGIRNRIEGAFGFRTIVPVCHMHSQEFDDTTQKFVVVIVFPSLPSAFTRYVKILEAFSLIF